MQQATRVQLWSLVFLSSIGSCQILIHGSELSSETVLESVQFVVEVKVVGLNRKLSDTVAGDALDVVLSHRVVARHIVDVLILEMALENV